MRRHLPNATSGSLSQILIEWHQSLKMDRRAFLTRLGGGSLLTLFGLPISACAASQVQDDSVWSILDHVQQHLFPTEADAPGATEINALGYLKFVVNDPKVDFEEREFILKGAGWLEGASQSMMKSSFLELSEDQREQVLRQVAASPAGENWISTLILYLIEALLSDPAYGGNRNQIGWRWLEHIPGFPLPTHNKIYPRLV